MAIQDTYRRSAEEFGARLQKVAPDAWDQTTRCCPDWTIRDLVNHVVNENKWIPPLLAGKTIADVGNSLDGDLLGNDPIQAYRRASTDVLDAMGRDGSLERTVQLSSGPTPAEHYLAEVLSDQIIHTWDLASSIGTGETLDPSLVEFAGATLRPLAEMWRAGGALGPPVEVDAGADDQTKLLALLGRRA
jgi:uncharacterized protein (TIGR03086 family)